MSANPIPGLFLPSPNGDPLTAQNWNALLRWSKGISPRMLFVDSPLAGSNPPTPPSDAYLCGGGYQAIVFASGVGTLTFPQPFPNGLLAINPVGFHAAGILNIVIDSATAPTAAAVVLYATLAGSAINATVNVTYWAIGW